MKHECVDRSSSSYQFWLFSRARCNYRIFWSSCCVWFFDAHAIVLVRKHFHGVKGTSRAWYWLICDSQCDHEIPFFAKIVTFLSHKYCKLRKLNLILVLFRCSLPDDVMIRAVSRHTNSLQRCVWDAQFPKISFVCRVSWKMIEWTWLKRYPWTAFGVNYLIMAKNELADVCMYRTVGKEVQLP